MVSYIMNYSLIEKEDHLFSIYLSISFHLEQLLSLWNLDVRTLLTVALPKSIEFIDSLHCNNKKRKEYLLLILHYWVDLKPIEKDHSFIDSIVSITIDHIYYFKNQSFSFNLKSIFFPCKCSICKM